MLDKIGVPFTSKLCITAIHIFICSPKKQAIVRFPISPVLHGRSYIKLNKAGWSVRTNCYSFSWAMIGFSIVQSKIVLGPLSVKVSFVSCSITSFSLFKHSVSLYGAVLNGVSSVGLTTLQLLGLSSNFTKEHFIGYPDYLPIIKKNTAHQC